MKAHWMALVLSLVLTSPGVARAAPIPLDFSCVGCFPVPGTPDSASDADGYVDISVSMAPGVCTPAGLGCTSDPCSADFTVIGYSASGASGFYCDELLDCLEFSWPPEFEIEVSIPESVGCGSVVQRHWILGNKSVFTWAECTKCKKIRTPPF